MIKRPNIGKIVNPYWSYLLYSYNWETGERTEMTSLDTVESARANVKELSEKNKEQNETNNYYFVKVDKNRNLDGYHQVSGGWKRDLDK